MTFEKLMERLKAAKSTLECITVELDAIAAARNGSITTHERAQLVAECRLMSERVKSADGTPAIARPKPGHGLDFQ
jgi:hypothetical protein